MIFRDCISCQMGDHSGHGPKSYGKEGVIDGEQCVCQGDCAERSTFNFEKLYEDIRNIITDEALPTPEPPAVEGGFWNDGVTPLATKQEAYDLGMADAIRNIRIYCEAAHEQEIPLVGWEDVIFHIERTFGKGSE